MPVFDEERIKRIVALAAEKAAAGTKEWTPDAILQRLDEAIIGNLRYKQALTMCLSDYLGKSALRNHLLVAGPSGTGKTYLLEQCLPLFGLPFHVVDASSLVPAGYKGMTLQEAFGEFFRLNAHASKKAILVLDEFDKISEKANGGDLHKSHSIQSELLTLVQGKQEAGLDTRNSLWILLGAFAYTDEMKAPQPKLTKQDLMKYGFKNELLGRITTITQTDIPTPEEIIRRVVKDRSVQAFAADLSQLGFTVEFTDDAFLEVATATQNPNFGMRVLATLVAQLKQHVVFHCQKGAVLVSREMVADALRNC